MLPLEEHGFALLKREFRDALCIRYAWPMPNTATECVCGKPMELEHALSCPCGGFPSIRHNEIRDLLADLLTEVCPNVCTEPRLQPLSDERLDHATASTEDNARADIQAGGFWGSSRFETALFDVRVFNPFAESNRACP